MYQNRQEGHEQTPCANLVLMLLGLGGQSQLAGANHNSLSWQNNISIDTTHTNLCLECVCSFQPLQHCFEWAQMLQNVNFTHREELRRLLYSISHKQLSTHMAA